MRLLDLESQAFMQAFWNWCLHTYIPYLEV